MQDSLTSQVLSPDGVQQDEMVGHFNNINPPINNFLNLNQNISKINNNNIDKIPFKNNNNINNSNIYNSLEFSDINIKPEKFTHHLNFEY